MLPEFHCYSMLPRYLADISESLSTLAPPLIAGNFMFPQLTRVIEPMCVNQSEPHLPTGGVGIAFVIPEVSLYVWLLICERSDSSVVIPRT